MIATSMSVANAPGSDGRHHSVSHHEAQAQGKPGEERGSSAKGTEVSWVQLYGRRETAPAHCAESDLAVQSSDPRTDEPDTRNQHGAESQGTLRVPAWMAWLLQLLPNTLGAISP